MATAKPTYGGGVTAGFRITRDDRLETVATDIVRHFLVRGFVGKAMVVSIDKATALKMHDKVKALWAVETAKVQKELGELAYLL